MINEKHIEFLVIIASLKRKEQIIALLHHHNAHMIKTIHAKGSIHANMARDIFGFIPDEKKVVATCLVNCETDEAIINAVNRDLDFAKVNTGIAFTIPVEGLLY